MRLRHRQFGGSFFYSWSELSVSPVDWFRFGLVGQRTRAYQTDVDIQRGLLVGFSYKKMDFTKKGIGNAIARWNADELEDDAADRGMLGSICRSPQEWLSHPQGSLLGENPLIEIIKIGDSEPELPPLKNKKRPRRKPSTRNWAARTRRRNWKSSKQKIEAAGMTPEAYEKQ